MQTAQGSDTPPLTLVSHHLCPYVQRAAIALAEKGTPYERIYVDLADKPDWFLAISPLGKVPVLKVGAASLFESAAILEFLEDSLPHRLHPADALARARHRAWIEFGSAVLNNIAVLYNASDKAGFDRAAAALHQKFERLEEALDGGPYFAGAAFSLVDAVFGPVFRYFDVFDTIGGFGILAGLPRVARWRRALAARPSVRDAVTPDYPDRLRRFLGERASYIATQIEPGMSGSDMRIAS
jgi:glutathione S-transferase